jgi:hypothetical protein
VPPADDAHVHAAGNGAGGRCADVVSWAENVREAVLREFREAAAMRGPGSSRPERERKRKRETDGSRERKSRK